MTSQVCSSCQAQLASPVCCASCQKLQEQALDLNYFELMGLKTSVDPDLEALKSSYLNLSREIHPDFNQQQQELALKLSTHLNEAHKTLSDRCARYEYFHKLLGGQSATDDKSTRQEFLVEMLQRQEELEDITDSNELNDFQTLAHQQYDKALDQAADWLHKKELKMARQALNEVNYCQTLINHVNDKKSA